MLTLNGAQVHLLLNHWPVLLPMVSSFVTAIGLLSGLRQTRNVGLSILVCAALLAVPSYFSGEPAQNVVQNYPLITVASIEKHEEVALYSFCALAVVGALAGLLLLQDRRFRGVSDSTVWALVVLEVLVSMLMAQTAHLGGLIRHEELDQGSFHELSK